MQPWDIPKTWIGQIGSVLPHHIYAEKHSSYICTVSNPYDH